MFPRKTRELLKELRSQSPLLTLRNLWGMWLLITLADALTIYGSGSRNCWTFVPNAIFNLLTPMLLGNLGGAFSKMTLPLMLVILFAGNLVGGLIHSTGLRITYNLVVLLLLTASLDYITWGHWISFVRFLVALGFGRAPHP